MQPDGWEELRIEDVSDVNPEALPASTDPNHVINYIDISSIERTGRISSITAIPFAETSSRARRIVRKGDILVSTVRPYLKAFARVSDNRGNLIASTGYAVLRAKSSVAPEYLYQYILSSKFVDQLTAKMKGSNYPAVSAKDVSASTISIPPIDEQRKIADVLQSVDEAITATQDVIDQTRKVKQGLLHRLLTRGIGHTTFKQTDIGEIPESWEVKTLEEIADVSRGKFSARPRNDPQFYCGDIPFIQTGDITASEYYIETHTQTLNEKGLTVSKIFDAGTIFITIAANIGDTAMSRIPMACPDSVVGVKAHEHINSHWLMSFLRTQKADLDSKATVNAQKNINLTYLKPMKVPVPPKDEQDKIAELLSTITDAVMSEVEKSEQLQTVKAGLMSDLLSGRVRVPRDDYIKEAAA